MDPLLERFNRLIKSMFIDEDININFNKTGDFYNEEKDYADAWQELNDFLGSPELKSEKYRKRYKKNQIEPVPPDSLKKDYKNLEVPFGSDLDIIKKSYKQLLIKHHPDKNSFSSESLKISTEKTKTINVSFQRIKAWEIAKRS